MFAKAETPVPAFVNRVQQNNGQAFFRKAEEETLTAEQNASFFTPSIQAKLNISRPDDPQEKEADEVAGQVMRMPDPAAVTEKNEDEGMVSTKLSADRIQRAEMFESALSPEEQEEQDSSGIQRKAESGTGSILIHRSGRAPPAGLMNFERDLSASKGNGSPMSGSTLEFMQSRFNADFSGVRIHTGGYADSMSRAVNAQAFTHGSDIYFSAGKYSPHTEAGGTLLAHELTHTIQQGAVKPGRSAGHTAGTVQRSETIMRVPAGPVPQLTAAVEKAKSKEGKVNADKTGPDGFREGWSDLLDFFRTSFGPDKITGGSAGTAVTGTVAEQDIKKKRITTGLIVNKNDINGDRITGRRDAMPSWCGIFVFWALNKGGVPMPKWQLGKPVIKPEAAYPPGYTPRTGDIAYKEGYSHFAIVESAAGSNVTTVNGNTAGEDNLGGQIQTREHPISNWTAFFNPLLMTAGPLGSGDTALEEKPEPLKELQKELFNVNRKENGPPVNTTTAGKHTQEAGFSPVSSGNLSGEAIDLQEETGTTEEKEGEEHAIDRMPVIRTGVQGNVIQNGWFSRAISFINTAVDFVRDGLAAGKRLLLRKAREFARKIPGYKALTVILGEDPITGEEVLRNGRNFIEAALDIIPGGTHLFNKLNELGAIDEAAVWVDSRIAGIKRLVSGIVARVTEFWNGLSLSSLAHPMRLLRQIGGIIHDTIASIVRFAVDSGRELLSIVKRWLLTQLAQFIRSRTNAYPLLIVILGKDPITEQHVDRNGTNILNALLLLRGAEGEQQRRMMQETGTFERVAAWIDRGIRVFGNLYDTIRNNFSLIWGLASIETLMHPVEKFREIYNVFAQPVRDVLSFVADAVVMILKLIKEVLMRRLSAWARGRRGYYLITVIIGKDPFTHERVERNTENIIHGFMSLMSDGEEQFAQMKESGAIARATARIDAAVARLNMTPQYIISLFIGLWNSFSLRDLLNPIGAFRRIFDTLTRPIFRLIAFVIEIVKIVVMIILEIMQFPFDLINNIITRAIASFHLIRSHPIRFLKNLLRAIKEGFAQFFRRILTHLINGLVNWLTAELRDSGAPPLNDLSLRGIFSWVLQILDISMEKIWEKLERHPRIGPQRVAKIRSMIGKLEGIWTFIRDVQERGLAAIWDRISGQLANLWDTIINTIKDWIMERIIRQVTVKLLSMLDPTGIMAVINSCIAIYKAIQSFIKYLRQMLSIVNSFVEGVAEIAAGSIKRAADVLEKALADGIPIVIGFLANQIGLTGIGHKIGEILKKVRVTVDNALEWLVNKAVDTGMALLDKVVSVGKKAIAAITGWWKAEEKFTAADSQSHRIYFAGQEGNAVLMIQSNPTPYTDFLKNYRSNLEQDDAKEKVKAGSQKKTRTEVIEEALGMAEKIETEKRKEINTYPGKDEKEREAAKATAIDKLLKKLVQVTIPLFGTEKPSAGEVKLPEGAGGQQFAGEATAVNIFNVDFVKSHGSPPSSAKHDIYDVINLRRKAGASYYIRGHLINDNLGGPGTWGNMTALSRSGNHDHESKVESVVKAAFYADAVIRYRVEASGNQKVRTPEPKDKKEFVRIPDIDAKFDLVKRIIEAEKSVPDKLKCEAFIRKKKDGKWEDEVSILKPAIVEVDNPVETSYSSYELDGSEKPVPVNLTLLARKGINAEEMKSFGKIVNYPGNKEEFAFKIIRFIKHKREKTETSFFTYQELASYIIDGKDNNSVMEEFAPEEKKSIKEDLRESKYITLN